MENSTSASTGGNNDELSNEDMMTMAIGIPICVLGMILVVLGIRYKQNIKKCFKRITGEKKLQGRRKSSSTEEASNENAHPAGETDPQNTPLLPRMAETRVDVRYRNCKKVLTFDITKCTFKDLKTRIETMFGIEDHEKYYHILALVPVGEDNGVTTYDIDNDNDIRAMRNPSLLMVYPGGVNCIRLGEDTFWLTEVPAPNSYIVIIAKQSVLPGYNSEEKFVKPLEKILQSLTQTTVCLIMTDNIALSHLLNHFGNETLLPVFNDCSDTFRLIVDDTKTLLDGLMATLALQHDDLPAAVMHLKNIEELAQEMQIALELRVKDLKIAEKTLDEDFLKKVEDKDIKKNLNDAIIGLRALRNSMQYLYSFLENISRISTQNENNPFKRELKALCEMPSGRNGAGSWDAQSLGRSKVFKTFGVVYIAKHVAIREICDKYQVQFGKFLNDLQSFLQENWNKVTATKKRRININDGQDEPNTNSPAITATESAIRALFPDLNRSGSNQGILQESSDDGIQLSKEDEDHENADHAKEPDPSTMPLLPRKSGTNINVRYKDQDEKLDFNLDGTYNEMRDNIKASFQIADTYQFRIVAKDEENGVSTDIVDVDEVRRLSGRRFSIDVYPGLETVSHLMESQDNEHKERTKGIIVHHADISSQEFRFLQELTQRKLDVFLWNTESTGVPDDDLRKLEKFQKLLREYDRVILAFPRQFQAAQLVLALNEIVKRQRTFVTVIMYANEYNDLPVQLQEFNIRRIVVSKHMPDIDDCVKELDESHKHDLAFLNFGNGLAWSYYFGYLSPILPGLRQTIMDSNWKKGRNIPEENISKVMIVYPKIEIMKKDLKGNRLIFHKNEVRVNRAGIDRRYEVDVREVKSRDLSETYYGVADYVTALKVFVTMGDNYKHAVNKEDAFLAMDEATMVKQGRYFYERLRLLLTSGCMQKYNQDIGIDGSKFELVDFDTPRRADEETLVDDLFDRFKKACSHKPVQSMDEGTQLEVGITYLPDVNDDIRNFIGELQRSDSTVNLIDSGFAEAIQPHKSIFMVLSDALVSTKGFENSMYRILREAYSKNNRRFLVCLDCLTHNPANHPELELLILFKRISYSDTDWQQKVKRELQSDPQEITHDLMFHNIGKGFALSYYNGFLKFRIPTMRNIVVETPYLLDKFRSRLMSHKLFILHPHSCKTKNKVSDGETRIEDRDEDEELKVVKFPDVINDRRVFTPKLSSITDTNGKKYIAFLEFNTQAETLRRMMDQGFLDENLLSAEWERFSNTLSMLIHDEREPLGLRDRLRFIRYDDRNMTDGDLADVILEKVREEIDRENGDIEKDN